MAQRARAFFGMRVLEEAAAQHKERKRKRTETLKGEMMAKVITLRDSVASILPKLSPADSPLWTSFLSSLDALCALRPFPECGEEGVKALIEHSDNLLKLFRKEEKIILLQMRGQRTIIQNFKTKIEGISCKAQSDAMASETVDDAKARKLQRSLSITLSIFEAINSGMIEVIERFCTPDLLKSTKKGQSPLHHAVLMRNERVVQFLLERGADPMARNSEGMTPIEVAMAINSSPLVRVLSPVSPVINLSHVVRASADLRDYVLERYQDLINKPIPDAHGTRNSTRQTPLIQAIKMNDVDVAGEFVDKGADVNQADANGNTPCHWAASLDNPEATSFLARHDANLDAQNSNGDTPLIVAAALSSPETVRSLLVSGADPSIKNFREEGPLVASACRGPSDERLEVVEMLVQAGANPNEMDRDNTPVLQIVLDQGDDRSALALLQSPSIDPNAMDSESRSPLALVVERGKASLVKEILEREGDPNIPDDQGLPPLFSAPTPEIIGLLADHRADLDVLNSEGRSAAMLFAVQGKIELVKELVDDGADPLIVDHNGSNLLLLSAPLEGSLPVVQAILSSISSSSPDQVAEVLNHQDQEGRSVAHVVGASRAKDSVAKMEEIIGHGADLRLEDRQGDTPAHKSARSNNGTLAPIFRRDPEVVNATNSNRETPVHAATDSGHIEAVRECLRVPVVNTDIRDHNGRAAEDLASNPSVLQELTHRRMVVQYLAKQGFLVIGLRWKNWNDLDVHLICPCGTRVYFNHRHCPVCDVELDVDMNVYGGMRQKNEKNSDEPVEHITFNKVPRDGLYRVYVSLYAPHDPEKVEEHCDVFFLKRSEGSESYESVVHCRPTVTKMREGCLVFSFEVEEGAIKTVSPSEFANVWVGRSPLQVVDEPPLPVASASVSRAPPRSVSDRRNEFVLGDD